MISVAKQHAEWLNLIDINGPFLTVEVLMQAFPQGLDGLDTDTLRMIRSGYQEWEDSFTGSGQQRRPDQAVQRAWIELVLKRLLEYGDSVLLEAQRIPEALSAEMAEHGETLRPDYVLANPLNRPEAGKPRLLIKTYSANQELEKPIAKARWKTSPATRMRTLLQVTKASLGLITNGNQWMLVSRADDQGEGFITWYANLWLEEKATLQAFRSLLRLSRFFGVAEAQTIEALLKQAAQNRQEVTDRLGYQVRRAIEVFVQTIDRIDKDRGRALLVGVSEKQLYEAALAVMMRLVFLLSAEEKELLLLGDEIYDRHYAVSTLGAKLREEADQAGEEILERRYDAWARLLATFRAVHGGIEHDRLRLSAYGGSLFDPDRFPFLEGRERGTHWRETEASPIQIDNRTVLHLLEALQLLEMKVPGGWETRRLSFRTLDVEQIGHVYEGLLDHTARRAKSPVLGLLGAKNLGPEVELKELEKQQAEGALVEFLKDITQRSEATLRKAIAAGSEANQKPGQNPDAQTLHKLLTACDNDDGLRDRVLPFLPLVRTDTHGLPVVITAGSVYVTEGEDRRTTGTHYTPQSLTEPIVRYTLEPLVYIGVAEGHPKEEWKLRPAAELLRLKVCDLAMGSGAFLVQTCRYLAERLVEAWDAVERANPGKVVIAPEGTLSDARPDECPIPKEADERLTVARRIVADRCLYGVDVNPMAVEMAKLSLWLVTLQKNRPFTFLDHALRCGDSLLGVTDVEQIRYFNLKTKAGGEAVQIPFAAPYLKEQLGIVEAKRQELESFTVNDINDLERKERMLAEAETALERVRLFGDLLIGDTLRDCEARTKRRRISARSGSDGLEEDVNRSEIEDEVIRVFALLNDARFLETAELSAKAQIVVGKHRPFHWALEFPEVFGDSKRTNSQSTISGLKLGGFDAFVGNPPFSGGTVASTALGEGYMRLLREQNEPWHGKADLVGLFIRKAAKLLKPQATIGVLATASLIHGETVESSLVPLLSSGHVIYRANSPFPWPGQANVTAVTVNLTNRGWNGEIILDEEEVVGIGADFEPASNGLQALYPLQERIIQGYLGIKLSPGNYSFPWAEYKNLPPIVQAAMRPAIGGEDLYQEVNFEEGKYSFDPDLVTPEVQEAFQFHTSKELSLSRVKHSAPAKELREQLLYSNLAFGCAETTHVQLAFVSIPTQEFLLKHTAIFFPATDWAEFAILQSNVHGVFAWKYGIRRKEDLRYSPKRCSKTFPLPSLLFQDNFCSRSALEHLGLEYHEHRQSVVRTRQEGITTIYNRFHDPNEKSEDIQRLRALHVEMDNAAAAAYGWQTLALGHDFHPTKQGMRFTISEAARVEVLDRLLALNHERYAEEVRLGLHDKGNKKKVSAKKRAQRQADASDSAAGGIKRQSELFALSNQKELFED